MRDGDEFRSVQVHDRGNQRHVTRVHGHYTQPRNVLKRELWSERPVSKSLTITITITSCPSLHQRHVIFAISTVAYFVKAAPTTSSPDAKGTFYVSI
jgi:hypothetical protein